MKEKVRKRSEEKKKGVLQAKGRVRKSERRDLGYI